MRYSFDRPRKIRTIICVGIVFEISLALWIWNADFFEGIRIYLLPFVILHAAIGVYELTVNNYYEFHDGCLIMKYSQFRKKKRIQLCNLKSVRFVLPGVHLLDDRRAVLCAAGPTLVVDYESRGTRKRIGALMETNDAAQFLRVASAEIPGEIIDSSCKALLASVGVPKYRLQQP